MQQSYTSSLLEGKSNSTITQKHTTCKYAKAKVMIYYYLLCIEGKGIGARQRVVARHVGYRVLVHFCPPPTYKFLSPHINFCPPSRISVPPFDLSFLTLCLSFYLSFSHSQPCFSLSLSLFPRLSLYLSLFSHPCLSFSLSQTIILSIFLSPTPVSPSIIFSLSPNPVSLSLYLSPSLSLSFPTLSLF